MTGRNHRGEYGIGPGPSQVFYRLCKAVLLAQAVIFSPTGCSFNAQPAITGLSLTVSKPIVIPPGRAHAILQGGRLARASNKFEPYCELELEAVSGAEPQRIKTGNFEVSRIAHRSLLDPTTRIPSMLVATSCTDPLFRESVWWLRSDEPSDVMFLRCIAPYYNCAFGPPLSPAQVQQQVGRYLTIRVVDPVARLR